MYMYLYFYTADSGYYAFSFIIVSYVKFSVSLLGVRTNCFILPSLQHVYYQYSQKQSLKFELSIINCLGGMYHFNLFICSVSFLFVDTK